MAAKLNQEIHVVLIMVLQISRRNKNKVHQYNCKRASIASKSGSDDDKTIYLGRLILSFMCVFEV